MGVLLYLMIYGYNKYPFFAANEQALLEDIKAKVINKEFNVPDYPPISPVLLKLFRQIFKYEEADRISWPEIFNHEIMQTQIVTKLLDTQIINDDDNLLTKSVMNNRKAVLKNNLINDQYT